MSSKALSGSIYAALSKQKSLTVAEEAELILAARGGSKQALDKLVIANLPFLIKMANRIKNNRFDINEMISVGTEALIKSVANLDVTRGVPLRTFAFNSVSSALSSYTADETSLLKRNTNMNGRRVWKGLATVKRDLGIGLSDGPLSDEDAQLCAERLGVSAEDIREAEICFAPSVSISSTIGDTDREVGETISDGSNPEEDAIERLNRADQMRLMLQAIETLSGREKQIALRMLQTDDNLAAIALEMGVSRERVRQIKDAVLAKLRRRVTQMMRDRRSDRAERRSA